jgi:threonine dehydrogenase-like Zn-dependent dehydrogenase
MGHEAIGVVEAVGADVRTMNVGDVVVMPFAYSDGTCLFCHEGLHTSCIHGGFFGTGDVDGAQAEAVRVPQADGTLVVLPVGKEHIIILGRHPDRIALAREFGATDVVSERGDEAVERVRELTDGFGVHSVLECVGLAQSMLTALSITRPGGAVGRVGVPQEIGCAPRRRARRLPGDAPHEAVYQPVSAYACATVATHTSMR